MYNTQYLNSYENGYPQGVTNKTQALIIENYKKLKYDMLLLEGLQAIQGQYIFKRRDKNKQYNCLGYFDTILIEGDLKNYSSVKIRLYNSIQNKQVWLDIGSRDKIKHFMTELRKGPIDGLFTYSKGHNRELMCLEKGIFRTRQGRYLYNQ